VSGDDDRCVPSLWMPPRLGRVTVLPARRIMFCGQGKRRCASDPQIPVGGESAHPGQLDGAQG
jgi:hypothetical protein